MTANKTAPTANPFCSNVVTQKAKPKIPKFDLKQPCTKTPKFSLSTIHLLADIHITKKLTIDAKIAKVTSFRLAISAISVLTIAANISTGNAKLNTM